MKSALTTSSAIFMPKEKMYFFPRWQEKNWNCTAIRANRDS